MDAFEIWSLLNFNFFHAFILQLLWLNHLDLDFSFEMFDADQMPKITKMWGGIKGVSRSHM
jgi:hypothetical protein